MCLQEAVLETFEVGDEVIFSEDDLSKEKWRDLKDEQSAHSREALESIRSWHRE